MGQVKLEEIVQSLDNKDLYEMLTDTQKEYIFNQVRFKNVKEDVESQIEQNPDFDFENYTDEQIELLVNDVASRYVFDGEGDAELPYWDQINNLIEESSYYAEQFSRD